jgi:aspartyl protease family protein
VRYHRDVQYKAVLTLFGVALLSGWFVAGQEPIDRPAAPKAVARDNVGKHEIWETYENTDESVLARQEDGHFYANVDVDGDEIRFIVDTGATGIALTAEDAETLGFSWSDGELGVVGRGVSGNVYGKRVRLHSVRLGGVEIADVEAVIIPNGLDVSLLGQSFLSEAASVKIENDEMTIS